MIVLDASAALEILLPTGRSPGLADQVLGGPHSLHAPELIDVECAQVLRRRTLAGSLDDHRAEQALTDLADLRMRRWTHGPLMVRVWSLRRNLTAYDAVYAALAEALGATLLTGDAGFAGTPGLSAQVELIPRS